MIRPSVQQSTCVNHRWNVLFSYNVFILCSLPALLEGTHLVKLALKNVPTDTLVPLEELCFALYSRTILISTIQLHVVEWLALAFIVNFICFLLYPPPPLLALPSGPSASRRDGEDLGRCWRHHHLFFDGWRCGRENVLRLLHQGGERRSSGEEEAPSENGHVEEGKRRVRVGQIRSCGILQESAQRHERHG